MSKIERFSLYCSELVPDEKGDVVRFSDYERLQAELAEESRKRDEYIAANAELERRLAETQRERDDAHADFDESERRYVALALRVKALTDALLFARKELDGLPRSLGYEFTHLPKIDEAIATSDRTQGGQPDLAEEVIAEFLGEPVAKVTRQNGIISILLLMLYPKPGSYLYAPKVTK